MPESSDTTRQSAPDSKSAEAMRASLERTLAESAGAGAELRRPSVPDHTLLHRIGSGAYGEVWLARNALGTLRAVKVVYRARFEEDRPYEREFHGILKYEPVSRSHEGLVQVLHVGRNDAAGCFYYVMELAEDVAGAGMSKLTPTSREKSEPFHVASYQPRTLHSELACSQRLPPVEAAQFVLRLAGALAHLHAHRLVHRDMKPSNVIFVDAMPKLADIGLVTEVGSSRSFPITLRWLRQNPAKAILHREAERTVPTVEIRARSAPEFPAWFASWPGRLVTGLRQFSRFAKWTRQVCRRLGSFQPA